MSDVCAAAAIAAAEGGIAGIVGVAVGIANHAIHPIVHLKAGNAGGLLRNALLKLGLLQSRKLGFDVGVYAVNRPLGFAAALRHLALDAVAGLHDGHVGAVLRQSHLLAELANVALHLVAKIADAVSDVGQAVVDLSKLLAKQNLLLAGGGGILPELTLTIPAISAKAEHEQEQNHDKEPARTPAVLVIRSPCHSGDIAKGHTVLHVGNSFHNFL